MASLTVIYWRDIPAQVVAEEGRGRKRQQAKVAEWRKSAPEAIEGDLQQAAETRAAALDQDYDREKLAAIVASGGRAG